MLHVLHIHRQALQPVGHLEARQRHRDAADLLEIGELAAPPCRRTRPPSRGPRRPGSGSPSRPRRSGSRAAAGRGRSRDSCRSSSSCASAGRRLHDDLVLVVVLQPVRVLAVAAVGRAAARLHVGGAPGLRARARAGWSPDGRCRRPSPRRRAAGYAALPRPVALQRRIRSWKLAGALASRCGRLVPSVMLRRNLQACRAPGQRDSGLSRPRRLVAAVSRLVQAVPRGT